jgi:phosphoenolpyruvate synthase/pyruvate phosphate dikinase
MNIIWLGQKGCDDVARVGGKAANLSRVAASHRVPPGFCLTTSAFDRWAAAQCGARAPVVVLPHALHAEMTAAYSDLARRCGVAELPVAVRSSAVDEDSGGASFAGQHETYLNIVGADGVAQAAARCWRSLRAERAIEYRRLRGLSEEGVRLAVLVQQLVAAKVSAVAFSANPVTDSRDEVVITSSWGLGESVVGGAVTPDTYVVRKADFKVIERQIAEKLRMTVSVSGGTAEVDVPGSMQAQATLDDAQAAEIAQLATSLESTMGWPVDIECAYAVGAHSRAPLLYLLQCRPITTLGF